MDSTEEMSVRLKMQYIGVCTLLGRIAAHLPAAHEDHYGIKKAMRDANNLLLIDGNNIYFQRASNGGYAAFERTQLIKTAKANRVRKSSAK